MDRDAGKENQKCKQEQLQTGHGQKRKEKRKQLKTGDVWKRRKILRVPHMSRDADEAERLSLRPLKDLPKLSSFRCWACLSKKHFTPNCPCLEKIPEGQTIGPSYDYACITCGKLDIHPCCGNGHYAVDKYCSGCFEPGHWFWELRCPKGTVFDPAVVKPKCVEWEEVPFPDQIGGIIVEGPGYWKIKEVESDSVNQNTKKLKRLVL